AGDTRVVGTRGYHRIGWRQTEYHKPRFCCFHCSSVQSLRRISSDGVCETAAAGFSSLLPNQPQALSSSAVATKNTTLTSTPANRRLRQVSPPVIITPSTAADEEREVDLVLRNARLADRPDPVDIGVADGRIVALESGLAAEADSYDAGG